ncbi:MAG: hypothetical protein HC895_21920 [Leptolyngbyaceae cyanobacterium SM1_3_5]|nr:hypothetical protein [Leptolyngbyaceae cyanobacterium SM1_3_5]
MHGIQYRQTAKGRDTRSQLLDHIQPNEELTRDQWAERAGLTYEQVRRQTRNLVNSGNIVSRLENGQRYYSLRRNFKGIVGTFLLVLFWGWSVPVEQRLGTNHAAKTSEQHRRFS